MNYLIARSGCYDDTAVVVELGDGATDLGVVAINRDGCADDGHQLAPVCLVGGGVVLELLVDVVEGVELGDEDVGAADGVGRPLVDGTTMAGQIDAIAVVWGVGVDIDAPADADGIDLVCHNAGFTQYTSQFAAVAPIHNDDIVGPFDVDGGGGDVGNGLGQYRHKCIDDQGGVGGRDVGGAEQERAEQALVGDIAPLAAVLTPAVGLVFGQHDQPFGTPSGGSRPDDVVGRGGVV